MGSRYDAVAGWYDAFTADWSPVCLPHLPVDLAGQRVVDLACGNGTLSRAVAERGATVTAIDASAPMLALAPPADHVDYRHADATTVDWWDGEPFDGAVSNMALMDVEDLDAAMATIATVIKPRGWVLISLLHPCFPGREDTGTLSSWPPDRGYSWEGWWTTGSHGVRGHVGAHHRTLSTYLNTLLRAGLDLVEIIEPPADRPRILILRCCPARPAGIMRSGALPPAAPASPPAADQRGP